MSSLDDIVGVKPLAHRLQEALFMSSTIPAGYRDGKPAESIQAGDTSIRILIPQGFLAPFIRPKYAGLLHFEQGDGKSAMWRLDIVDKSYQGVMVLLAKEFSKKHGVAITAAYIQVT
jgi:hypothetical protein